MPFEFDEAKSLANKQDPNRNLDFVEAQALWEDDALLEIPSYAGTDTERWIVIGKIKDKHWTAAITYRGEKIRIISVRRSRTNEIRDYEQNKGN